MAAYYNEINPFAASWLRGLIADGEIAPGDVDERSISEVSPDDVRGYSQCHWFAGIGGWSLALRLAGWGDDRPVWTGSCPCQPFSIAGKGAGEADARHLWPHMLRLIRECGPGIAFGEQVAGAAGYAWWDGVASDLEAAGYAAAAADLTAQGVGAAHIRQRLYWFATDTRGEGWPARGVLEPGADGRSQVQSTGLSRMDVAGGRWAADGWGDDQPTIVRSADGLSKVVAGFGNAIVPALAARFVQAAAG